MLLHSDSLNGSGVDIHQLLNPSDASPGKKLVLEPQVVLYPPLLNSLMMPPNMKRISGQSVPPFIIQPMMRTPSDATTTSSTSISSVPSPLMQPMMSQKTGYPSPPLTSQDAYQEYFRQKASIRKRRKYEDIERFYKCKYPGCDRAYGYLNHLNHHIFLQKHGERRKPEEFKELREWLKKREMEKIKESTQMEHSHSSGSHRKEVFQLPSIQMLIEQAEQGNKYYQKKVKQPTFTTDMPSTTLTNAQMETDKEMEMIQYILGTDPASILQHKNYLNAAQSVHKQPIYQHPVHSRPIMPAPAHLEGQISFLVPSRLPYQIRNNAQKRKRRKHNEIERHFYCTFDGCSKAYGTLNHLNHHIALQNHGEKKSLKDFKE